MPRKPFSLTPPLSRYTWCSIVDASRLLLFDIPCYDMSRLIMDPPSIDIDWPEAVLASILSLSVTALGEVLSANQVVDVATSKAKIRDIESLAAVSKGSSVALMRARGSFNFV